MKQEGNIQVEEFRQRTQLVCRHVPLNHLSSHSNPDSNYTMRSPVQVQQNNHTHVQLQSCCPSLLYKQNIYVEACNILLKNKRGNRSAYAPQFL